MRQFLNKIAADAALCLHHINKNDNGGIKGAEDSNGNKGRAAFSQNSYLRNNALDPANEEAQDDGECEESQVHFLENKHATVRWKSKCESYSV